MTSLTADRVTARKKGVKAAAVAGTSVAIAVFASPFVGILGLATAGYLTYDWFMYRAKRGMRF